MMIKVLIGILEEYVVHYSKVSIKRPVLLNDLVIIFPKIIILFYFRAAMANFWYLSNDLVWIFGKSLY